MKKIYEGNENIVKAISIKDIPNNEYRLFSFVYIYNEKDIYVITNILTGEAYLLTQKEFDAIVKIKASPVNCEFIIENKLETLVYNRFIVENDYNDIAKYKNTLQIMRIMSGQNKGIKAYSVLTTTGCNARCIYCSQRDFAVKNMAEKTADAVIDYIAKTKCDSKIKICWFGGEPLVGNKMISHICKGLKNNNIEFISSMISNGALLNEQLVDEAVNLWNLKNIQISIDGEKSDYERKKQYVVPERDNYEKVMENIKLLSDNGIKVRIRSNYDMNSIKGLKNLIDDLSDRFGSSENIKLYFHALFQENENDNYKNIISEIEKIYEYAKEKGLNVSEKMPKGLKTYHCMVDSIETNVSIFPDGILYSCRDSKPEFSEWGNIYDGITDLQKYNELKDIKPIEKECERCCFLPLCTSFYKKGCPNSHKNCYYEKKAKLDHQIRSLISDLKEKGELNDKNL